MVSERSALIGCQRSPLLLLLVILFSQSSAARAVFFFFFLRIRGPRRSTLFPYTTLSRSHCPPASTLDSSAGSSRPRQASVGVISQPSCRRALMLPAAPTV